MRLLISGIAVFLIASLVLVGLLIFFDNTCCNGLWKSLAFRAYIENPHSDQWKSFVDFKSHLLYVQYGSGIIKHFLSFTDFTIFRKMAVVNALSGGLALTFFFFLIYAITGSFFIAVYSTFFHLACGVFLILSTNADDVLPSYSFFVGSAVSFFLYLKNESRFWLIACSISVVLSWFLHWTMAVAPLFAFPLGIVLNKKNTGAKITDLLFFFGIILLLTYSASRYFDISLADVWFPVGSGAVGWNSFHVEKFILMLVSMPRYIFGSSQVHHFKMVMEPGNFFFFALGIFIYFKLAVALFKYYRSALSQQSNLKPFLVFLLINFIIGQSMNAYEFGTDSQFLIQPMIWVPVAFAAMLWNMRTALVTNWKGKLKYALPVLLLFVFILNRGIYRGEDTHAINEVNKIGNSVGGYENAFFITHGWDAFTGWAYAIWGGDDHFHHVTLASMLESGYESKEKMLNDFEEKINSNLAAGKKIIVGPFWERSQDEILIELSGFYQEDYLIALLDFLKTNYTGEKLVKSPDGYFYLLYPVSD